MGFDSFGEAAFESGIVKTMLKVTQDERTDTGYALASYNALESMFQCNFFSAGNPKVKILIIY
jgi:hypothetical protein